ncbi:hypothetical protein B0H14DRAFT_2614704 [Mycena olivaceomarginata]|nr:hypothetical protein B0H14DRAFT_2614704 [Mycena olivaceomarginata]
MTLWELPVFPPNISGCSHAFELMLGAPSIFNWNVGCSQPNMGGRSQVCELSMGAPIAPTEGSWEHPDYYKGAPMAVRRELPCTLESPECRSVKNPVEAGNVFCTSVEGGYRGAGKKHSTPAEEGGNEQGGGRVKCIPQGRGGQEGSHKGAVSQVGGYNVFHSTEGRHRGTAVCNQKMQNFLGCTHMHNGTGMLQQTGPAQAPKSQNNPALAGVTCDNTGSIQPNRRMLPQKKEWVVPGRDIATGGSSQGLGAYSHHHQDGDPLRVVISDIHNQPNARYKISIAILSYLLVIQPEQVPQRRRTQDPPLNRTGPASNAREIRLWREGERPAQRNGSG